MSFASVGLLQHTSLSWSRHSCLPLLAAVGLVLAACGSPEKDRDPRDGSRPTDAATPVDPSGDAQSASDADVDAGVYVPPPETLPPLPVPMPTDAGVVNPVFFGRDNPVIYINDYPRSVYTDGYIYALAANRDIQLRGVISSGNDCMCSASDNYPVSDTPAVRTAWITAAREAGFQHIPDNTLGTQGPSLAEPASGNPADTARIGSAGSDLIVREARLATPERPLLIIVGGGLTTVADALLADPSITKRVVISMLIGLNASSLDDGNGRADPWATRLVMRSFRVFVFPGSLDPPYVPESRMIAEFPDTALRALLLEAGYYREDYDEDGQPAVTVMLPTFVKTHVRRAMGEDLGMVDAPNGNIWVMTQGDPIAGGNEFFRALNKAFLNVPDGGVGSRDAGAADAGAADAGIDGSM